MGKKYSNLSPAQQALLEKWKRGQFKARTIPPRPDKHPAPLSFSQQRLWFIDQLYQGSPFHTIPAAIYLKGMLQVKALKQSLNEILRRHDAWRTTFRIVDGEPVQVISSDASWELPILSLEHLASSDWQPEVQRLARIEAQKTFDLAQGPLVRATLLRLGLEEHVFLLVMHHIISDGWSLNVFARELSTLYAAFSAGQPSPLPRSAIQYADFVIWQREHLQGERLTTQLNYWQKVLEGDRPDLQFPTDRPRPTVSTFAGARQSFAFPQSLGKALHQFGQQNGATMFMTLLAAFNTLLCRYTGQEDILIGTPVANRNRPELEGMLGLFVNTLVMRSGLKSNPSFRTLLQRVRQVALGAYAHQDLPFEMLVETLHPERNLSRNPLFQVMFALQNAPMPPQVLSGLTWCPLDIDIGTAMLDLFLSMTESEQGLTGFLEYSTDLFDVETVTRIIDNFQVLLEGIIAHPDLPISELPLLTAHERSQLLGAWSQTHSEYPQDKTLHQLFEEQVVRSPDALALLNPPKRLTYQQLNQRANQLAHYLQALGVRENTCVAICSERSIDTVIGILAILKAGGVYMPLDPNFPRERLAFMLSDSQAAVVITQQAMLSKLPVSESKMVCLDLCQNTITQECQDNPDCHSTAATPAYVIYTSGSTGTPKGVLGTHQGAVNGLHWLWKTYPFSAEEVCCQKTALSFIDSIWEIFAPLLHGIPTVIIPDSIVKDPKRFLDTLAHFSITRIVLVPSLLRLLLETDHHLVQKLSALKLWITSGEALSLDLVRTFRAVMSSATLVNLYGSSEVSANVTCYDTHCLPDKPTSVAIGRPIDNTQVYVLDGHLQPTPVGVWGELYIGGDGLAKGYLNRADLTQEQFIDHPFVLGARLYKTGDIGRYRHDGQLEYGGRCDEQVKIRGVRIELGEIETAIKQHPAVRDSVVVACPKAQGDMELVAYVVSETENLLPQLSSDLQRQLPSFMLPSAFAILTTVPLTPSGKVDKRALPTDKLIRPSSTQSFIAPRNFSELALAKMWENLLGTRPIGVLDNFFDVGGHSFLAVRLMAQIYEKFGHNLPLSTLFENATIEQLAKVISRPSTTVSSLSRSPLVAVQPSGSKTPFFCVHAAGGGVNSYLGLAQKLGAEQPFYALEQTPDETDLDLISIEETATAYLKAIRAVQTEGPYRLGGWCYGGVVAFEMAQQLLRQAQSVEVLVIIDAILPETVIQPTQDDDAKFLLRLAASIKNWFGIDFPVSYGELRDLPLEEQFCLLNRKANLGVSDAEMEQHLHSYKLFKAHIQSMRNYIPQPYPNAITLIRASEKIIHDFDSPEFQSNDPFLGWGKCASQPINVINVPGNHFSIFNEPHVLELAKQLGDSLGVKPIL